MSARGSTAKISSLSSMSPPALASDRVCTLTFILAFLALVGFRRCLAGRSVRGLVRVGRSARVLLGRDRRHFLIAWERRHLVDGRFVDEAGFGNVHVVLLQ